MYGLYTSLAFDHFRWRGKSYLKRLYYSINYSKFIHYAYVDWPTLYIDHYAIIDHTKLVDSHGLTGATSIFININ